MEMKHGEQTSAEFQSRSEAFGRELDELMKKYRIILRPSIQPFGPIIEFFDTTPEEVSEVPGVPKEVIVDEPTKVE